MSRNSRRRRHSYDRFRRRTKPGASPGTIVPDPCAAPPVIEVIAYGPEEWFERQIQSLDELPALLATYPVVWVNVNGLGDAATIEKLGTMFQLHRLALEDVVNVHQRAKVELYGDHLFIVVRTIENQSPICTEQIGMFLGRKFVITFQERPGDDWNPVRERLRQKRGRIRNAGPDYLAYALIDAVIDSYFPVLDILGEQVEQLDEELTQNPRQPVVGRVHEIRQSLHVLRRAIWPHRDALAALTREHHDLISDETRTYLRDCQDHTIQIIDLVENDRDLCSDLRDFYLSAVSNRMNEIMKVLTIITTLLMPLSLIASIYGMNFNTKISPWNMPELEWRYGYPATLGAMVVITLVMVYFFYRRGWFRK
ncbi:MAG: magnesium/cobalt transporter CorA [Planctomycetes bacterium]|nr:magnesium/cobalt transporter CorA [Planctomycetota bacterium]